MMRVYLVTCLISTFPYAQAAVIADPAITLSSPGLIGSNYSLFVPLDFSSDQSSGGSFLLEFDNTSGFDFTVTDYTIGNEFRVFVLSPGETFGVSQVRDSSDFFGNSRPIDNNPDFAIPVGQSVFLAYWVDVNDPPPSASFSIDREDQYGWIEIENLGGPTIPNLNLKDSAVSLSDGIIVGTNQVPEPSSTLALLLTAVASCISRKR